MDPVSEHRGQTSPVHKIAIRQHQLFPHECWLGQYVPVVIGSARRPAVLHAGDKTVHRSAFRGITNTPPARVRTPQSCLTALTALARRSSTANGEASRSDRDGNAAHSACSPLTVRLGGSGTAPPRRPPLRRSSVPATPHARPAASAGSYTRPIQRKRRHPAAPHGALAAVSGPYSQAPAPIPAVALRPPPPEPCPPAVGSPPSDGRISPGYRALHRSAARTSATSPTPESFQGWIWHCGSFP